MAVKVDLLPSYSLGRYFQLAALALFEFRFTGESLTFEEQSEYVRLVKTALEKVIELKVRSRVVVAPGRVCDTVKILCENIDEPKFMYNRSVDRDFARKLGIEEVKGCEISEDSICHLLVAYMERLLRSGISNERVKLPMLLRSTIFGKIKGPQLVEVEEAQLDSVGLALLGALTSYLGTIVVGDGRYEYYVIPDGSYRSLKYFIPVMETLSGVVGEAHYAIPEVSRVLTSVSGLSLDLASYLATLINVLRSAEATEKALGLASNRAFEPLLLARLEVSEYRPQVLWIGNLAISDALLDLRRRGLEVAMAKLYHLIQRSGRSRNERLASVTSICVNSIATATLATVNESAKASALLDCARGLASLLDDEDVPEELRSLARTVLESLSRG